MKITCRLTTRRPTGAWRRVPASTLARWERDLASASFEALAREHTEAVAKGVFGVTTLTWPEGRSYYVKITDLVSADRAVSLYDAIETVQRFTEVVEIKTPESEGTLAA